MVDWTRRNASGAAFGTAEQARLGARHAARADTGRLARRIFATVPIVLASSMAIALTSPMAAIASEQTKRTPKAKDVGASILPKRISAASAAAAANVQASAASAPTSYTVVAGDTISVIASRFGLSTASVLAMNGLGWKSLIFPGQVLTLGGVAASPTPTPVAAAPIATTDKYVIQRGDTISGIAARHGISTQTLLSANGLGWSSIIYPGQTVVLPGAAVASVEAPVAIPAPAPAPAASSTYTIVAGDTVSTIAGRFGVTVQAVLDANGLTRSSVIFTGHTLQIPGAAALAGVAAPTTIASGLNADQVAVAQAVIAVGRSLGVSDQGIVIALATAAQESTMRNLDYGDRDSVGVFQQRPSAGWGSVEQLTTVSHSAALFYGGPSNPNKGKTRGLLDIPGWESMTVAQAAQAVQISAFPDAYAKWEAPARTWLAELG